MEVKLIVASGKHAGKEIPITKEKFLIGRAEDCQLRPHSDLVSRHHCVIFVEEGFVAVRDFGSKNGTQVNDATIQGEQELKNGDKLKVGSLELDVQLKVSVKEEKKPEVETVQEPTARTGAVIDEDDLDLDSWLNDTKTLESTHAESADTETVTSVTAEKKPEPTDEEPKKKEKDEKGSDVVGVFKSARWKPTAANPRDAAADTLKNFFKRH
jgi:pSer/pThr/pTyr-binding forkhead associated (FHA) protein